MSGNVSPLTSIYYRPPWPYLFPLVCLPPLPLCHSTPPPPPPLPLPLPPCVWQSHSRPCVRWRRYIMPSFHCTPDQREQSSTEKLLLADFSSLPPSHCFISTQRCTVDRVVIRFSIPLHVEKQTEQMGNDQRFTVKRKKKKKKPTRLERIDASGIEILHLTFFDVLSFIYLLQCAHM